MKNYTYNTFTVDGHEFSMTDYKDEMKVYIKSIHPYDDADYHWALNRNGGDLYVIYIGSPGKKVDTVFGSKEKVARKLLELDKNVESRMSYESNLIKRAEKLLNESEKQIYNVEYNYADGSQGLAIGHVKVRANSEEEALEKAEKYASNRHYRDDSYYIEDSCKIVKSGYSNDPIIESSQKNEDLQLVDKADPDFQLGDAYIAKNKEDLINGLDKLTLGDTVGAFVNYLDEDSVTGELNVEMVDEDLFKISMEEYTKENADDWEGKDVLDTEFLTKEETIYQLNLILEHWEIIDKLNEDKRRTKIKESDLTRRVEKLLNESLNESEELDDVEKHLLFILKDGGATLQNIQDMFNGGFSDKEIFDGLKSLKDKGLIKTSFEGLATRYYIKENGNESIDQDLKSSLKMYLDQTEGKFKDIPDRNNVDWKNVSDNALRDYERLGLQLFNKKKSHDSFAYSVVKSVLDNNLDGAVIDWIKVHMEETPEIAKALKEFDAALQEKDLTKSWKAYQNLWDIHRNSTKRKYTKTGKTESINEELETKNYNDVEYTLLPDGEYVDIKIYAPKGKAFKNGDTFYTTQSTKDKADDLVKDIIDNDINESINEEYKSGDKVTIDGKQGIIDSTFIFEDGSILGAWIKLDNNIKYYTIDELNNKSNKNESVTYHFSVEDIGISGNNWIFPEEAYEEAKSRLSKLGYKVSDLTDDLEFTVIGDSTGVAYDGVIYSKEDANESVSEGNLDEIYKVLDYYMAKLGFNLVEDRKPYFINKKYIKSGDTNYIHFIDFTPQMDNDQLKYEVRDEKGHQKLCNTYNILDAVDMDTSLQLIEFDMEGFE